MQGPFLFIFLFLVFEIISDDHGLQGGFSVARSTCRRILTGSRIQSKSFFEFSTGTIQVDYLRELLTTVGDRFTDEEVDELYREAPIDKKGNFNYIEFTRILKHGAKDKDD